MPVYQATPGSTDQDALKLLAMQAGEPGGPSRPSALPIASSPPVRVDKEID
jgi:hypothetical protein